MKPILILNDLHLGTQRTAGTTQQSAAALKEYLFESFEEMIFSHVDKDLLINGDLFDKFSEDESTIDRTFDILYRWLTETGNTFHNIPGNHDFSAKADKLSSFHLLANVLKTALPKQVIVYESAFAKVNDISYVIPHCLNQDLFEYELEEALKQDIIPGTKLFLHANFVNNFADHADHSLNITEDYGRRLRDHGYQLIVAHEHQGRCVNYTANGFTVLSKWDEKADVIIAGNQFPSSIADCLAHGAAQKDGCKYAHILSDDGLKRVVTWDGRGTFARVQWDDLASLNDELFVRVEGEISQAMADEVFSTIQKYRSKSPAFVITNAVKIDGINVLDDDAAISLESIKAFDVKGEFMALFSPEERKVLDSVLED